jgi:hypothetical protein
MPGQRRVRAAREMTRVLLLGGVAAMGMIAGGLLPLSRKHWSPQTLLRFMGDAT